MGTWGIEPWDSDGASDWLHRAVPKLLVKHVRATLKDDASPSAVRGAAWVAREIAHLTEITEDEARLLRAASAGLRRVAGASTQPDELHAEAQVLDDRAEALEAEAARRREERERSSRLTAASAEARAEERFEDAVRLAEEALAAAREPRDVAGALLKLGTAQAAAGRLGEAAIALRIVALHGGFLLYVDVLRRAGLTSAARAALAEYERVPDDASKFLRAWVLADSGRAAEATEILASWHPKGDYRQALLALDFADLALQGGDPSRATADLKRARELLSSAEKSKSEKGQHPQMRSFLPRVRLRLEALGQWATAASGGLADRRTLDRLQSEAAGIRSPENRARVVLPLAEAWLAAGDPSAAAAVLDARLSDAEPVDLRKVRLLRRRIAGLPAAVEEKEPQDADLLASLHALHPCLCFLDGPVPRDEAHAAAAHAELLAWRAEEAGRTSEATEWRARRESTLARGVVLPGPALAGRPATPWSALAAGRPSPSAGWVSSALENRLDSPRLPNLASAIGLAVLLCDSVAGILIERFEERLSAEERDAQYALAGERAQWRGAASRVALWSAVRERIEVEAAAARKHARRAVKERREPGHPEDWLDAEDSAAESAVLDCLVEVASRTTVAARRAAARRACDALLALARDPTLEVLALLRVLERPQDPGWAEPLLRVNPWLLVDEA